MKYKNQTEQNQNINNNDIDNQKPSQDSGIYRCFLFASLLTLLVDFQYIKFKTSFQLNKYKQNVGEKQLKQKHTERKFLRYKTYH